MILNFEFLKILLISIFIDLYFISKLNIFIKFIEYIGGPLFKKIFQVFKNLKTLENHDYFHGTIGYITINDNFVEKRLYNNIFQDMSQSLYFFEKVISYKKINIPFYFNDFFNLNMEQLNLNKEKEYSLQLRDIFKNLEQVKIINIFESDLDYHKSELIDGLPIHVFLKKHNNIFFEKEIYILLNLSYYLMISSNLFHCDWHFGNFLVNFNKDNKIVLHILDTGLMGKLDNIYHDKLKVLITTSFLKPDPINIIKFLCYVNLNEEANISKFMSDSKKLIVKLKDIKDNEIYSNILVKFIDLASYNKMKFPVVIIYMFQSIIFINKFCNVDKKDIKKFSQLSGFEDKIKFHLH